MKLGSRSGRSPGWAVAMVALLALLGQTPAPSGEASVAYVKTLLAGFGARGPIRLQSLGWIESLNSRRTKIEASDSRGFRYTAYLTQVGRIWTLHRDAEFAHPRGTKTLPLSDSQIERTVRNWLTATGTHEPTRLASLIQDENGIGHASFPILRNGHPFVSHQRYGFDFRFIVKSREFLELRAMEGPPPVDGTAAKLDRAAALAALQRIYDTEISPETINVRHRLPYPPQPHLLQS